MLTVSNLHRDLHLLRGLEKTETTGFIMGHEFTGTVVAVGNRPVERIALVLKLGTRENVKQHSGEHLG